MSVSMRRRQHGAQWLAAAAVVLAGWTTAAAQEPAGPMAVEAGAEAGETIDVAATARTAETEASRETIVQLARDGYRRVQEIQDYTCLLVKRERVGGVLQDFEYMQAKVRHQRNRGEQTVPFSVYLRFLAPADVRDREVLYVEGRNSGKLVARKGGPRFSYITTDIDPYSDLAMQDNRYPITEFGFENLVKRFLEHVEGAILDDCTIQLTQGAKVDDRPCLCIQVSKNRRTQEADFYLARVYIDEELQIPIHYEAFDWPVRQGDEPRLLEQYTYRNVRLNVGLNEADFRRDNPAYGFRRK